MATTLVTWSGRVGIGSHEIAAFGDMPIDLPMLTTVSHSYAVANAHPDVLAAAHHRAPSNDEDSVAQVLEWFVEAPARRSPGQVQRAGPSVGRHRVDRRACVEVVGHRSSMPAATGAGRVVRPPVRRSARALNACPGSVVEV
jgi:hypothetical protein